MMKVAVTNGHILMDGVRYEIGDTVDVSDERARNWENIGVAKIVVTEEQEETSETEPETVDRVEAVEEATVQEDKPAMKVEPAPFKKSRSKKRGSRRG